jgi:hypothetical protein
VRDDVATRPEFRRKVLDLVGAGRSPRSLVAHQVPEHQSVGRPSFESSMLSSS